MERGKAQSRNVQPPDAGAQVAGRSGDANKNEHMPAKQA